jgi:putative membrane protein
MSCTLTERTLEIRKGWINRVESTIPLEKITDLQMIQGPIMRAMGLHGFKVETAGQSSGPGASLVSLVGIVDAPGFREAVLDQRDAMAEGRGRAARASEPAAAGQPIGGDAVAVLSDIRASLHRIEKSLEHRKDVDF